MTFKTNRDKYLTPEIIDRMTQGTGRLNPTTTKVVDDYDNMIFDPVQGKEVPDHKRITIDAFTGEEIQPEPFVEDPLSMVARRTAEEQAKYNQEVSNTLHQAKANGEWHDQPWLANVPKAGVVHQKLTEEKKVLSEFVATTIPSEGVPVTQPVGNAPQRLYVGDITHAEKPDIPVVQTTLPVANTVDAMYGSMENAMAMNAMPSAPADASSTIVTDIPGSIYAEIADAEIMMQKMRGQKEAFIDMEVGSTASSTYGEFKAIMSGKGYRVSTQEMVIKSSGPSYRVHITW